MSRISYYAVARGRNVGIYSSWDMCKEQVNGFNNARYKKFSNMQEAADFVSSNTASSNSTTRTSYSGSYPTGGSSKHCESNSSKGSGVSSFDHSGSNSPDLSGGSSSYFSAGCSSDFGSSSSNLSRDESSKYSKGSSSKYSMGRAPNYRGGSSSSYTSMKQASSSTFRRGAVGKRSYAATSHNDADKNSGYEMKAKREKIEPSSSSRSSRPVVYTDGACSSNGKHGAKAGYGVYWGEGHPGNSYGPVHGSATNNRGELLAVIKAIETAKKSKMKEMTIRTDSQLCIDSCDSWIKKWEKNGWKTSTGDVKNKDLLVQIQDLRKNVDVRFEKVKAHCGEPGNEAADALARKGATLYKN